MKRKYLGILSVVVSSALISACKGDTTPATGTTSGSNPTSTPASFVITASGGAEALKGYDFPFASTAVGFVDGWEVRLTEVLTTVDKITLSESPDTDAMDATKTGAVVAEVDGPFVVDLQKGGPIDGEGQSPGKALQIATLDKQNKNGDKPFATDARYALGFDIVPASASARLVNLDDKGKADYELMKQKGYTVLYVGTATFKGIACTPADPEFDKLPKVIDFKLGFKSPATYINCENPDNDATKHLGGEIYQRGVVAKSTGATTAQLSLHLIHPFLDKFTEGGMAHFDPIAARFVGATGTPTATLEDMVGVDPKGIKDKAGNALPWRTCSKDYTPPSTGMMAVDPGNVPVDPAGDATKSLRDLYDYMTYNQSMQAHLNGDGLCAMKRSYPSPP